MYDPLGHFVYFESNVGTGGESGRKRNTAQTTSLEHAVESDTIAKTCRYFGVRLVKTRIILERAKWYLGYPLEKLRWLDN